MECEFCEHLWLFSRKHFCFIMILCLFTYFFFQRRDLRLWVSRLPAPTSTQRPCFYSVCLGTLPSLTEARGMLGRLIACTTTTTKYWFSIFLVRVERYQLTSIVYFISFCLKCMYSLFLEFSAFKFILVYIICTWYYIAWGWTCPPLPVLCLVSPVSFPCSPGQFHIHIHDCICRYKSRN